MSLVLHSTESVECSSSDIFSVLIENKWQESDSCQLFSTDIQLESHSRAELLHYDVLGGTHQVWQLRAMYYLSSWCLGLPHTGNTRTMGERGPRSGT